MTLILTGFAVLLIMIMIFRIPIAFSMGVVGFFDFAVLNGLTWDNIDREHAIKSSCAP
jgi:hypothetical protein